VAADIRIVPGQQEGSTTPGEQHGHSAGKALQL